MYFGMYFVKNKMIIISNNADMSNYKKHY